MDKYGPTASHPAEKRTAQAEDDGNKIIGRRYLFAASPLTPVAVVAVQGGGNDWAAYISGMSTYSEPQPEFYMRVYREGAKLTEEQARGFFPSIEGLAYRQ